MSALPRPAASPRRNALLRAAIALATAIMAAAMGPSSTLAVQAPAVAPSVPEALSAMSTGEGQALLGNGVDARARNARIPVVATGPSLAMPFAEIDAGSAQYGTALKCLTQAIYYEAANEPELGKRAVAQVIINRLRHPEYPSSICGVVYEGASAPVCQFSFTCDGSLLRTPLARQWADSRRVAQEALAGSVVAEVGSATHYHADYVLPRWAFTLGKLTKVGRHIFYRFRGRAGTAAALKGQWAGVERIPALDLARLRAGLDERHEAPREPEQQTVPGLTVTPHIKDRHAATDVGGRLDTTTGWRLSIPDPAKLSTGYRSTLSQQGMDPEPARTALAAQNAMPRGLQE